MSGLGHNGGPTLEGGTSWRRFVWTKARADLMPKLPLEVARRRVRRAAELGIDYKSYAGIRAATGRDIIALIFSDNALRLLREGQLPDEVSAKLDALRNVDGLGMAHPPLTPAAMAACHEVIRRAARAPGLSQSWRETRQSVLDLKQDLPGDGVVVIGATSLERDWSEAGRLAGFLHADRFLPR